MKLPYTFSRGIAAVVGASLLLALSTVRVAAVVGYINVAPPPGYSLYARQVSDSVTNNVESLFLLGLTNLSGATIFKLNQDGFVANNYLAGWSVTNLPVGPGEAFFVKNPYLTNQALTAVGDIVLAQSNLFVAGFSARGCAVAVGGLLKTDLGFPIANGDRIFCLTNGTSTYTVYNYSNGWAPSEPRVAVMQGMWVQKSAPTNWVFSPVDALPLFVTYPIQSGTTGQLNFFTYNATNSAWGRGYKADGITPLSAGYRGQLYAGTNANESSFVPLGVPVSFMGGAAAGYLRAGTVFVPFAQGGQSVWTQVRVWDSIDGASFEQAATNGGQVGKSAVMALTARAVIENGQPGFPPPDVNQFPAFNLQTMTAPNIEEEPQDLTVNAGESAAFTVVAKGTAPLNYQWRFNGNPISAATNVEYAIASAQTTDEGSYDLVVANAIGAKTSVVAVLTVQNPVNPESRLLTPVFSPGTGFQCSVTGQVGASYVVYVATNIAAPAWSPIWTNVSPFTFVDPAATNAPGRFYRAAWQP